ncbi:MAG: hypothetical protein HRU01_03340 [Myxococcales bacterium]|nr:hypothetical protein [Myxococcales bacterium]
MARPHYRSFRSSGRAAAIGFASALLGLGGCSFVQLHHYPAPSAPGGEAHYDTEWRCGWKPGQRFTGPPDRVLLRSGELVVGVQAEAHRVTTWTAGPLFLPVLPAIPPSAFPQRRLGDTHGLAIDFRVIEPAHEDVDFSGVVVEVVSSDGRTRRFDAREEREEEVPFERWTSTWRLADGFGLERAAEADPGAFRLRVTGISYQGVVYDLPTIEFTPARGWMMCEEY